MKPRWSPPLGPVVALALGVAALVYREPLMQWFDPEASRPAAAPSDASVEYTCPMHPSVRQRGPGKCPLCGMTLTPVAKQAPKDGAVLLDAQARERAGVRTELVARAPLVLDLRAVGEVQYDETRLSEVSLRVGGWAEKLHVDATGQRVHKGQPLLELWSPELLAAQQDHLALLGRADAQGEAARALVAASRRRLDLLGMTPAQVAQVEQTRAPLDKVTITAPADGVVIEKDVVEGARIEPGMRLYRIGAVDQVWVEARVQERDLPHVHEGQAARVFLPDGAATHGAADHAGAPAIDTKVALVYPELDTATRTARVRLRLPNGKQLLRPGAYVDVELSVDLGERLVIADAAVLYTGPRRIVFVDQGQGRFVPREVHLGAHAGGRYEVLHGLDAGERVVTSGNFLVAAESRLRSGSPETAAHDHAGH